MIASSYNYWYPEDVWALKKLGFRLPANYKINR
jgi:hypothetical protein